MPLHTVRVPMATQFDNRDSTLSKDAKIVNGYIEQYPDKRTAVVKRPGLSQYAVSTGCGQGIISYNGSLITVTGNSANLPSLADGTNWTSLRLPAEAQSATIPASSTNLLHGSALVYRNQIFVIGMMNDQSNPGGVYYSSDGINWNFYWAPWNLFNTQNTNDPYSANLKACVHNNLIYVILSNSLLNDTTMIWSSNDGLNWTLIYSGAVTSSRTLYSTTNLGASWTTVSIPLHASPFPGATSATFPRSGFGFVSFNGYLWIYGGANLAGGTLSDGYYSTDGLVWTHVSSFSWTNKNSSSWWIAGSTLYMYGSSTVSNNREVWSTTDGLNWTLLTASGPNFGDGTRGASSYYWQGKHWLLSNLANTYNVPELANSTDGITWTTVTLTGTSFLDGGKGGSWFASHVVFNNNLWSIGGSSVAPLSGPPYVWHTSTTASTALSTSCELVSFAMSSQAAGTKYLMIKGTTAAYLWDGGALIKITDVDYPPTTVPGVVQMDGYFFVMDNTATIYNSNLEDPTTWNSLNYIRAETEPGQGVAIAKYLNYIVAFKQWSIELFYDAANATGSPLARMDSAFSNLGCTNGYSVMNIGNTIYWMSQQKTGVNNYSFGRQICRFNGLQPEVVSTPFIDKILSADTLTAIYSFAVNINGHEFYVITLKSSNITLAYDINMGAWYQWTSLVAQAPKSVTSLTLGADGVTATAVVASHGYSDGDPVVIAGASQTAYNGTKNISYVDANTFTYQVTGAPSSPATGTITATGYTEQYFLSVSYADINGQALLLDESSGIVYQLSPNNYDDSSKPINYKIRTSNLDASTNHKKFISRLDIIGDKVTSNMLVRYSNDDYTTWSKYRTVKLGNDRSYIHRLGRARRRAFEFRDTDSVPLRIEAFEITIDGGEQS